MYKILLGESVFLHRKNIQPTSIEESHARFRSVNPASEGILGRTFHRVRSLTAKILAATMLFTSSGASFYSCSQSQAETTNQTQIIKVEEEGHAFGKTDETGKAIFYFEGKTYEARVIDGENGQPINGMLVSLSVDSRGGLYRIVDPENRYFQRFAGAGVISDQKADSSSNYYISNITTYRKDHPCALATKLFAHVDFGSEEDMKNLYAWNQEYLEAKKKGKEKTVYNPLTNNFDYKSSAALKDLNNSIKQIFELLVGEALEADIEVSLITYMAWLGIKGAKKVSDTFSKLNPLIILDLCALSETLDWARYYDTLCYKSNDEFDIWKAKSFPELSTEVGGFELGAFLTNPMILIIPKDKESDWVPPVAEIKGKITTQGYTESLDWGVDVQLDHINGYLGTVLYPHGSDYNSFQGVKPNSYYFTASACKNTEYRIKVRSSSMDAVNGLTYDEPSMILKVEEGKIYTVDFHLTKGCGTWNYEVNKTGENSYEVVCKPGKSVCDNIEKHDYPNSSSSGESAITKGKIHFEQAKGCLAQDSQTRIYFSGRLNPSDPVSLYSFDDSLNLVWNFAGAGSSTPIISSEGVSYTLGSDGKIHALSSEGLEIWVSEVSGKPSALSLQNDVYAVNSSSVFAITKGGALKWEYKSEGSEFDTVTVALGGTVYASDAATNSIFALESEIGKEIWKKIIPDGLTSPPSFSGGSLYLGSVSSLYELSEYGELRLLYADGSGLSFSSPTFNSNGYRVFTGWHLDCKTTLQHSSFGGSKFTIHKRDGLIINSPTMVDSTYVDEDGETKSATALIYSTTYPNQEISCSGLLNSSGIVYFIRFSEHNIIAYDEIQGSFVSLNLSNSSWPMENHDPQNTRNANFPIPSPPE